MSQRICSIDGCETRESARGWCNMHYLRWLKYGDPGEAGRRTRSANFAVWELPLDQWIDSIGWTVTSSGCWEWNGARHESGYGTITATKHGLYNSRVHRVVWELHNGPIPDGLVVRHRCDNPPCCRPDHLELGTQADNSADMKERGRSIAYATGRYDGVCLAGLHDTTLPGALRPMGRVGKKYMGCVECARERQRRYDAKKRSQRQR